MWFRVMSACLYCGTIRAGIVYFFNSPPAKLC